MAHSLRHDFRREREAETILRHGARSHVANHNKPAPTQAQKHPKIMASPVYKAIERGAARVVAVILFYVFATMLGGAALVGAALFLGSHS